MSVQIPAQHPKRNRPAEPLVAKPPRADSHAALVRQGLREVIPAEAYLFYGRKSKRESARQMLSLDQQRNEVERYKVAAPWKSFLDSQSGTSFDRPQFQAMIEYCIANPQPTSKPKRIVMWDYCRFSREYGDNEAADLNEVLQHKALLEQHGWILDSVRTPYNENFLVNFMMVLLKFHEARKFVEGISKGVIRGKQSWSEKGYWLGGCPPYPCERVDPRTDRVLSKGERSAQASVLKVNPELLPHWIAAAKMRIAGKSYHQIAMALNASNAPRSQYYRTPWGSHQVKKMLVNPALVGKMFYHLDGGTVECDAKWGPQVPVDIWLECTKVCIADHERVMSRFKHREPRHTVRAPLLRPVCSVCRCVYTRATCHVRGKVYRYYKHAYHDKLLPEQRALSQAAGCAGLNLPMDWLDTAVRDLLLNERTSKEYRQELARARDERIDNRGHQEVFELSAKADFETAERDYKRLSRNLALVDDEEVARDIARQLKLLKRQMEAKQEAWMLAREQHNQASSLWQEFEETVEETEAIVRGWSSASVEVRRRVMDWWVDVLFVVPKRLPPRTKKAKRGVFDKEVLVWLRTNPQTPKTITIPGVLRSESDDTKELSGVAVLESSLTRRYENTYTQHRLRLSA